MFCAVRTTCMCWYILKSGMGGGGVVNIWLKKPRIVNLKLRFSFQWKDIYWYKN